MERKTIFNDDLIENIAIRLGSDWYRLGFYLELGPGVLNNLQESVSIPVIQKPFKMLKRWREKRLSKISEIEEISQALIKSGRRDLSDYVIKNTQGNNIIDLICMKNLSERLVCDWNTLGIYLGLSFSDLAIINESVVPQCHQPPGTTLLEKWRNHVKSDGSERALSVFLKALKSIKRYDLVSYIESEV